MVATPTLCRCPGLIAHGEVSALLPLGFAAASLARPISAKGRFASVQQQECGGLDGDAHADSRFPVEYNVNAARTMTVWSFLKR
jgi:hypothetical protein